MHEQTNTKLPTVIGPAVMHSAPAGKRNETKVIVGPAGTYSAPAGNNVLPKESLCTTSETTFHSKMTRFDPFYVECECAK